MSESQPPSTMAATGNDSLAVRQRYLRSRRRIGDRGWIALWVFAGAALAWLFIAGFTGLNH